MPHPTPYVLSLLPLAITSSALPCQLYTLFHLNTLVCTMHIPTSHNLNISFARQLIEQRLICSKAHVPLLPFALRNHVAHCSTLLAL